MERRIQEGLVGRWDLGGALKDRQGKVGERPIQVADTKKKKHECIKQHGAASTQCEEGEAAGLATSCPAFLLGCREGPVCEHLVDC